MNLNDVHRGIQKYRKRRRIGRGTGSGLGKTSGRGHKGQRSRAGWSRLSIFQGGAMPLVRRVPKRGFNNAFADSVMIVNLRDLEQAFDAGADVNPDSLREKNLAKGRYDLLKVLGEGTLTKSLTVSAHRFSKSAVEKIEAAGGKIVRLAGKTPVAEKQKQKKQQSS